MTVSSFVADASAAWVKDLQAVYLRKREGPGASARVLSLEFPSQHGARPEGFEPPTF